MTGDGSRRGGSDDVIDGGDHPMDCARAILAAISANTPELIFAKGNELALTQLRHDDPDTFFTTAAGYGEKDRQGI